MAFLLLQHKIRRPLPFIHHLHFLPPLTYTHILIFLSTSTKPIPFLAFFPPQSLQKSHRSGHLFSSLCSRRPLKFSGEALCFSSGGRRLRGRLDSFHRLFKLFPFSLVVSSISSFSLFYSVRPAPLMAVSGETQFVFRWVLTSFSL